MRRFVAWPGLVLLLAVSSCLSDPAGISVAVEPAEAAVPANGALVFRANVAGSFADDVEWRVDAETCGGDCGTIGADGRYRAPAQIPPGFVTVEAHSAVSGTVGRARVQVIPFEVEPSSASSAGGTPIRIRAAGFVAGGTTVAFGTSAGTVSVLSPFELEVIAPPHAPGAVPLTVEIDGEALVWPGSFRYGASSIELGNSQLLRSCFSSAPPIASDFDGDGLLDVAVACSSVRRLAVHEVDERGLLSPRRFLPMDHAQVTQLLVGDEDGDGDDDVFVGSSTSLRVLLMEQGEPGSEVSVSLEPLPSASGEPTGSPTPGPQPEPSKTPQTRLAAIGSVCGDGRVGALTVHPGGNERRVERRCRGASDTWTTATPIPLPDGVHYPSDVAVADLDGNGRTDYVVAHYEVLAGAGGYQVFLRGDGDSYTPQAPVVAGSQITSIALGRIVGGDAFDDLVLGSLESPGLWIAPGAGDGTFLAPAFVAAGDPNAGFDQGALEIADVDGDGHLDVTARTSNVMQPVGFQVFYGDGMAIGPAETVPFATISQVLPRMLPIGPPPSSYRLLTRTNHANGYLQVTRPQGKRLGPERREETRRVTSLALSSTAGTTVFAGARETASAGSLLAFAAATDAPLLDLPAGVDPDRLRLADIDGDGREDLVASDDGIVDGSGGVWAMRSLGGGQWDLPVRVVDFGVVDFDTGDLDGDGYPDIAYSYVTGPNRALEIAWAATNGVFAFSPSEPVGDVSPARLEIADLGGDGVQELLVADSITSGFAALRFDGARTPDTAFAAPLSGPQPSEILVGALGDDDVPDVAVRTRYGGSLAQVDVFLGVPAGTLEQTPQTVRLDEVTVLALGMGIGDLDGDRIADLVVPVSNPNAFVVLRGQPDGSVRTDPAMVPMPGTHGPAAALDLDGDGLTDVIACEPLSADTGRCWILQNDSY